MKLLEVAVDVELIKNNLEEFSDLNRHYIYQQNDKFLNFLEFENDKIFLEPTLFFNPVEKKSYSFTTSLEQLLFGYVLDREKLGQVNVISDSNGYINLPGFGYLKALPNNSFKIEFDAQSQNIILRDRYRERVKYVFEEFSYIKDTEIRICKHQPELLSNYFVTHFNESVEEAAIKNHQKLDDAYGVLSSISKNLTDLIELTNREVCVYNSQMPPYSMAALFYFGTAFLNTGEQNQSEVFFVDDLAHQCGHNIFYALTLDQRRYIVPPIETKMAVFAPQIINETRDVYGVFHGLFTYTTIIDTLSKCIQLKVFKDDYKINELIARLGFYMRKFKIDLEIMNDKRILTEEGLTYLDMFLEGYKTIYNRHSDLIKDLKYDNQTYIFEYEKYLQKNSYINF